MNHHERRFLLAVEHGDIETVQSLLDKKTEFNINCLDPLNRNSLIIAIDNENLEMVKLLLQAGIEACDSLLHAIDQNFVEAVELMLDNYQSQARTSGDATHIARKHLWSYCDKSSFSPDMTPLIVAAHRNNYEIIKLLLDRNICPLPNPHTATCDCTSCSQARIDDCLQYSKSRINAYKALASPCLMALSSQDPIVTAFELSQRLESLANLEPEYKTDFLKIRAQCQTFATGLLNHTRTSEELGVILNYSEKPTDQPLARLRLAINYKQKTFCAHPNVQEFLNTMWYECLPDFRRRTVWSRYSQVFIIGLMFPLYSIAYLVAPNSSLGSYIKKPVVKFICHSASYMTFLLVLMLASQRVEAFYDWNTIFDLFSSSTNSPPASSFLARAASFSSLPVIQQQQQQQSSIIDSKLVGSSFGIHKDLSELTATANFTPPNHQSQNTARFISELNSTSARSLTTLAKIFEQLPPSSKKRGAPPSPIELVILLWVFSLIWAEIKQVKLLGLNYYKADMWNLLDSVASAFYIVTIILRLISYIQRIGDISIDVPRELWDAYDPTLVSEGLFAAATIFSTLKIIYIFSLNPYLGPLQISLGRMIVDILRFSWIYILVVFSFACGLNQLLWYYADSERSQCTNSTFNTDTQYQDYLIELHKQLQLLSEAKQTASSSNTDSDNIIKSNLAQKINQAANEYQSLGSASKQAADSCKTWRYFSNVFESVQTLFWATFGLVDLDKFDLTGIKEYTRFWALLMFGIYCFTNIVVVLNILVAMMNHSYVKISKQSDIEWKFARTRLRLAYFDTGSTVPPPFNILPSIKWFKRICKLIDELINCRRQTVRTNNINNCTATTLNYNSNTNAKVGFVFEDNNESNNLPLSGQQTRANFLKLTSKTFNQNNGTNTNQLHNNDTRSKAIKCLNKYTRNTQISLQEYRNVIKLLVRRYLVHEQQLVERKSGLTEAKLNRWAKLNAFNYM